MVSKSLTNVFKAIIKKEDLIDTGALLKSARVFIDIERDEIRVNLVSKYYLKYLDDRYRVTEQFLNTDIYIEEIGSLILELYEVKIINIINSGVVSDYNPKVIILKNGRR